MQTKSIKYFIGIVLLLLVMIAIPNFVSAVTINSINYIDNIGYSAYDIRGLINGGTTVQTTYGNGGYKTYFKVGDDEQTITNLTNGGSKTINDVVLTITGTPSADNKTINVVYHIKNNSTEEKTYAIASTADTQLGNNDCAAIYKSQNSIVQITQDNSNYSSDYKTQVKIDFLPNASTTWIGRYYEQRDNRYVNGQVTSYTVTDHVDTGLAFSWNGVLAAGAETSYTASFTIREAATGNVSYYRLGEETPFSTVSGLIGGSVVTPALSSEIGCIYHWNTAVDGSGTNYDANKGIIISSSDMKLYEVREQIPYTITYEPNEGSAVESTTTYYGEEIEEPTEPTREGYTFEGWYSDSDFTAKYVFDKMPATNFTLYAKWTIIPGKADLIEPEEANSYNSTLNGSVDELLEKIKFTDEDKSAMTNGKNIDIYLEVKDISDKVSENDKQKIEEKLSENQKIGIYLDVNLFKRVEGEAAEKITETNETLKISFEIPENLINKDPNIIRVYKILRLHNGVVTELDVTVNGTKAIFETDEFSTYALTYIDTEIAKEPEVTEIINPKTGDNIIVYISLLVISMMGVVGTIKYSRKNK